MHPPSSSFSSAAGRINTDSGLGSSHKQVQGREKRGSDSGRLDKRGPWREKGCKSWGSTCQRIGFALPSSHAKRPISNAKTCVLAVTVPQHMCTAYLNSSDRHQMSARDYGHDGTPSRQSAAGTHPSDTRRWLEAVLFRLACGSANTRLANKEEGRTLSRWMT